jgi:amino acid permease
MTIVVDGTMHSALLSESGDEAWIEKDFGAQRRGGRPGQSSFLRTVINITKCFVGAASFELPWAFSKGGLVGSMVGVLGLALMSSFSLGRLAECPNFSRCGSTTYPELGREAFGDVGFALAWFGTIAMTLGVCGSYFVFISQTLHELTGAPTLLMLLGTLLFVGLLSWLKRLKTLAFTSALGVGALVLAVTVVTVHAAEPRESGELSRVELRRVELSESGTWSGQFVSLGVLFSLH